MQRMFAMRHSSTWEPPEPRALIDRFSSKFLMFVFRLRPTSTKLHRQTAQLSHATTNRIERNRLECYIHFWHHLLNSFSLCHKSGSASCFTFFSCSSSRRKPLDLSGMNFFKWLYVLVVTQPTVFFKRSQSLNYFWLLCASKLYDCTTLIIWGHQRMISLVPTPVHSSPTRSSSKNTFDTEE